MHVLTLVADTRRHTLPGSLVADVGRALRAATRTLSTGEAAEWDIADPAMEADIAARLDGAPIDVIVSPAAHRRKRLLVADMDSTIVTGETLDDLAARAGVGQAVAAITRRSMNGEIDFAGALRERVAMLRGLPLTALDDTWRDVQLTAGAMELVATMRAHGALTALVSGGFTWFTARVAARAGFDLHRANVLHDDGAVLAGTVAEPILDRGAKLATLRDLAAARGVDMAQTLAVGDGANDLDMIRAAGLGVAFHAKPVVAAAAAARIAWCGLRALLFAQGYAASEIVTPS